ncbi:hypothetical protein EV14_1316 [Prochlorococcus sp. MIT 0703]|nr:hypothetical protein EV12_0494 [Prochlorococcus sp. MIT 0701]KGG34222.1 hypothetical protein EV14_1316 [Prochlorococcus sp. MIT 0703]
MDACGQSGFVGYGALRRGMPQGEAPLPHEWLCSYPSVQCCLGVLVANLRLRF